MSAPDVMTPATGSGSSPAQQTVVLHVGEQYRGTEKLVVEAVLGRLPGVLAVEANPAAQTSTVTYDSAATSLAQLRAAIEECGFACAGCNAPGCPLRRAADRGDLVLDGDPAKAARFVESFRQPARR